MPRDEGKYADDDEDGKETDEEEGKDDIEIPDGVVKFMEYARRRPEAARRLGQSAEARGRPRRDGPGERAAGPRRYMMAEDFDETRTAFFDERCSGFEDAEDLLESGAGHPLEWTATYNKYIELYEAELLKYCKKYRVKEEQLCRDLESVIATCNVEGVDVLPTFLQSTEYDFFVANMHPPAAPKRNLLAAAAAVPRPAPETHRYEAARLQKEEKRALSRGQSDDPDDLTGMYFRPSGDLARWSWLCYGLQEDTSSPTLPKSAATVLVRPRLGRHPQVHLDAARQEGAQELAEEDGHAVGHAEDYYSKPQADASHHHARPRQELPHLLQDRAHRPREHRPPDRRRAARQDP